jgi:tRNA threonylcarbamoyl adenosine modification protein YjeE
VIASDLSPSEQESLNLFVSHIRLGQRGSFELNDVSLEKAQEVAKVLALSLKGYQRHILVLLEGQLGVGKTTFCQSFIHGWSEQEESVESPTYAYVIPYKDRQGLCLFHFDLYRLHSSDEFLALGFDEYWKQPGLSLIEWPGSIQELIQTQEKLQLCFKYSQDIHSRQWHLEYHPQILQDKD